MIKEVRLAMLGISLALGSAAIANAHLVSTESEQADELSAQLSEFTKADILRIRDCVERRDVLCLRAILVANPNLMQGNTVVSKALLKFMSTTDSSNALLSIFENVEPVIVQASVIY